MGLAGAVVLGAFTGRGPRVEALSGPLLVFVGLGGYLGFFGVPLRAGLRSLGWTPTPCLILSGEVRSETHHGMVTFTTYWPDVVYRYRADGADYRANTVNASDAGSPWYYGARRVLRRYLPGSRAVCYVDPAEPSEAVLTRSLSGTQWFGVWPLVMALLGAVGVITNVRGREPRLGTPRLWGTLALWAATTSALTVLWATGADLIGDIHEGVAEPLEYAGVALAGLLSAGLALGWVALSVRHRSGRDRGGKQGVGLLAVWDREFDGRK
jgi:hypothetical protein